MRQFASSGFRLWNLSFEARVLYTAFCVLTFVGIVSSALYYADLVGGGLGGIRRYYAGEDRRSGPAVQGTSHAGPAVDVPDEIVAQPIVVPVTYRKLLEVTHFHLFTMPVVLLIVAHLFLATGASERAKRAWVVGGAASVAVHIATPWLVRYAGSGLAPVHAVSGSALALTLSVLTLAPVVSMWRRAPAREVDRGPPAR